LIGTREVNRLLGRIRVKWEADIKIDVNEIGWDGVVCIHLAYITSKWRFVVQVVTNLWLHKAGNFMTVWGTLPSKGGLYPM
jgi:hypothetical protein